MPEFEKIDGEYCRRVIVKGPAHRPPSAPSPRPLRPAPGTLFFEGKQRDPNTASSVISVFNIVTHYTMSSGTWGALAVE